MRLFTKNGHDFFAVSSMLQKSLRRGDVVLASAAANEMLPKYSAYVWRRLMTVSAEDCSAMVTGEVVALYDAWNIRTAGKRQTDLGRVFYAKAIVLLAKCKHSRDADELSIMFSDRLTTEQFESALRESSNILSVRRAATTTEDSDEFTIPEWVYDVHTRIGKQRGMTKAQFLRDEHDALVDATTIFANFDEVAATDEYVEPELRFD